MRGATSDVGFMSALKGLSRGSEIFINKLFSSYSTSNQLETCFDPFWANSKKRHFFNPLSAKPFF